MLDFKITENYLLNIIVNTTLLLREDIRRYLFESDFCTLLRLDQLKHEKF